jgi:uncharacterized tellurite resistance protein B-like protein
MLRTLKSFFEGKIADFVVDAEQPHSLELASAALLMEISRADRGISAVEREAMTNALRRVCHLSDDEIELLLETSEQAVEEAVSLYDFTTIINRHLSRAQKVELIELLWRVAFADRDLDRYEEYYIRKIADLLHVSHTDFINTKHRAMRDLTPDG